MMNDCIGKKDEKKLVNNLLIWTFKDAMDQGLSDFGKKQLEESYYFLSKVIELDYQKYNKLLETIKLLK